MKSILLIPLAAALLSTVSAESAAKPLKALLVIGGCCHDYKVQKDLLEAGIEARAHVDVEVCYSEDTTTKATFTCYDKDDWAAGYDVVIHAECSADIKDPAVVNRILDAHRKGVPAVNLHCAMHSYRTAKEYKKPQEPGTEGALWFDFIGLQSTSHGPQQPIDVSYPDPANPITKGLESWTTGKEELYNNVAIRESSKPVAKGKQGDTEMVMAWTHEYGEKKARVFSLTLGHNTETIADARYLDFVTRGLLWACGKLTDDGKPATGYAPAAK